MEFEFGERNNDVGIGDGLGDVESVETGEVAWGGNSDGVVEVEVDIVEVQGVDDVEVAGLAEHVGNIAAVAGAFGDQYGCGAEVGKGLANGGQDGGVGVDG